MGLELGMPEIESSRVRRWPRYSVLTPVRVLMQVETGLEPVAGRGTQLNEGGMTLYAVAQLAVGEEVLVELTPAYADQPIRVPCLVRNRHCYTYGLEFTSASSENVDQLRSILREDYRSLQ